jgi:hypothetical protein
MITNWEPEYKTNRSPKVQKNLHSQVGYYQSINASQEETLAGLCGGFNFVFINEILVFGFFQLINLRSNQF